MNQAGTKQVPSTDIFLPIQLPIELPIKLPFELPMELPIELQAKLFEMQNVTVQNVDMMWFCPF